MKITSESLRERARHLLVQMTSLERWVYAIPRGENGRAFARAQAIATENSLIETAHAAGGQVTKHASASSEAHIVFFENEQLGTLLLEASGPESVPAVKAIVDELGFIPQSKLWGQALDVRTDGASDALRVLSHMAVRWDADWTDLFILHLSAPDPVMRHEATMSLTLAAMVARDAGPALELLEEAGKREKYPKLRDMMAEAVRVLEAALEGTVSLDDAIAAAQAGHEGAKP